MLLDLAQIRQALAAVPFLTRIANQADYALALSLMDELIDDYDTNVPLIDILSVSIARWENHSPEFTQFNQELLMPDYNTRTLCGLAAASLTHVARLSPSVVYAAVRDDPERAAEIALLCAAIAAAIPRERWPAVWSRPLRGPPFSGDDLQRVVRWADTARLRACVRRAVQVLADDHQSGEQLLLL